MNSSLNISACEGAEDYQYETKMKFDEKHMTKFMNESFYGSTQSKSVIKDVNRKTRQEMDFLGRDMIKT